MRRTRRPLHSARRTAQAKAGTTCRELTTHRQSCRSVTPRQIIAQFKTTQVAIGNDDTLGVADRDQRIAGAFALASRLIRFHPQLAAKGSTRSYLAELKEAFEARVSAQPRSPV